MREGVFHAVAAFIDDGVAGLNRFSQFCLHLSAGDRGSIGGHGLTGEQGVILPKDNVEHLMLDERVIKAVREGKFHIYPVTHIGEAMELLTGMPVGRRRKDGSFTKGTLFEKVDNRLHELGWLAEHSYKTRKRKG